MSGHIMIVDSVPTNRIVLKVKLSSAYYETTQAASAEDALTQARRTKPSAILLGDVNGMDNAQLVKRFRQDPQLAQLPLLVLLSSRDPQARLDALRAGADDVVSKPIDDVVLLARLRSLQRAREAEQELSLRESTHAALGLAEAPGAFGARGRVAFLIDDADRRPVIDTLIADTSHATMTITPKDVLSGMFDIPQAIVPDLFVMVLREDAETGLGQQILPELRSRSATRHAAVLVVAPDAARRSAATMLDMGANDLVREGDLSRDEMLWRIDKLVSGKHKADRLRRTTQNGLRAAVTDPLTGLYNRRYALPHLTRMVETARGTGRRFAVMVADLDFFKAINDQYGHPVGDAVLRDVAQRLRDQLRAVDMVARLGGEEFLIVMPETSRRAAKATAQRLCRLIGDHPFLVDHRSKAISATISIGIAMSHRPILSDAPGLPAQEEAETLLSEADRALYGAKAHGRNTVEFFQTAAA
ncbi:diguanylate cyclase [Roseobacteraceae bacterium S113]